MEEKWGVQQRGTEGERERRGPEAERERERRREERGRERMCTHSVCRQSANCYLTFESTLLILFVEVQAVTIR